MPKRKKPLLTSKLTKHFLPILVALFTGYQAGHHTAPAHVPLAPGSVEVRFSPRGGCLEMVLDTIDHADDTLYVAAYSLTSVPIADAIIAAHRRGVKVWVLACRSSIKVKNHQLDRLYQAGIPIRIDKAKIGHNKVMIVDGRHLLTGSYNWTVSAEKHNAENLLRFHVPDLCAEYHAYLQEHYDRGNPYAGKP